jgi:glycosyltransferase involved in cell wall biosynthesis
MLNSKQSENSHGTRKLFVCITKSNWGGAQKYVYDIATNTPRDQFDTTVLLGEGGELKKRLEEAGVKTILLKNSERDINLIKEFKLGLELIKIFRRQKPDIVHLNSSKMGSGALAARLTGVKKIIFTIHGWAFNEDRNFFSKILIKFLHCLTIALCDKTIAVSETTKKQIGFLFRKKIIVIKNGFKEMTLKNRDLARSELSIKMSQINPKANVTLSKNPTWVGTISELHNNKGLTYAIEAISKIKSNIIFIIIGEGEKRKELEALTVKLGVSKKVFLIGRVDYASLYLKAFDIFTLTSITEALPYAILEAGYASLPVIASNVGGVPEIIENNKNGILTLPKNSEEIKNSLEYLIKNPSRATSFGNALKEKISKDFTQKTMLEKTFALYKNTK